MISQNCPRCSSSRVRRGYKKTPFYLKLLFRYHLLCDGCNWEFTGFAVPFTVTSTPKRRKKKIEKNNFEKFDRKTESEAIREIKEQNIDKQKIKANL